LPRRLRVSAGADCGFERDELRPEDPCGMSLVLKPHVKRVAVVSKGRKIGAADVF